MSRYWTFAPNLTPGETARSEEVNQQFAAINTALTGVEAEMNRAFRVGAAANPALAQSSLEAAESAAQRANKVLACDAQGKPTFINAAFNFEGPWTSGVLYSINDVVQVGIESSLWIAIAQHTSSALFATDQATKWRLLLDLTDLRKSIRTFQKIGAGNSPYLAASGDDLFVDVTSGPVTVVLPAAPAISDQPISITHVAGPADSNNIIVARNGKLIMGLAENMAISDNNAALEIAFCDELNGWRLVRGT